MLIRRLETTCFRNLEDQGIEPGPHFNILHGANAQGKTNFLEAACLVSRMRSFRAQRNAEMIRFGEQEARVRARVATGGLERDLEVQISEGSRRVLVDGKGVRSVAKATGTLNVVLFSPDDMRLPRGAPGERRKLLDRSIADLWPGYISLARDYQKTLQSRNKLLKEMYLRGSWSAAEPLLEVYDGQLADLGAKLVFGRLRYLTAIEEGLTNTFAEISKSGVRGSVRYVAPEALLELKEEGVKSLGQYLSGELRRRRPVDRARQVTTLGPHTHDIDFQIDGRSTRSYGSQGQLRALLLSYKITQIIYSYEKNGEYPVLLLDDVSSELDADRNKYLFDFLKKIECQAFITTTRADLVLLREKRVNFKVVSGQIWNKK